MKTARRSLELSLVFMVLLIVSTIRFIQPERIFAQVIISEFSASSDPEWVELYNQSDDLVVELVGWTLVDGNQIATDDLPLEGCISPRGFRLFEHKKGWLNNDSDTLSLFDSNSKLVDGPVEYGKAGTVNAPGSDQSAYRDIEHSNWLVSDSPDPENTTCESTVETSVEVPTGAEQLPTMSSTESCLTGVILSEFMSHPSEGPEWVELKNDNDKAVVLTNWKIDDIASGGGEFQLFSATILAGGYYRKEIDGWLLNNSSDAVRLLCPDNSIADETSYSRTISGVSWIYGEDGWCQSERATPGEENSTCQPNESENSSSRASPTPTEIPPAPTPTLFLINTDSLADQLRGLSTRSGKILGATQEPELVFFPWEATAASAISEPLPNVDNESGPGKILLGAGVLFLFAAASVLWYTQLR